MNKTKVCRVCLRRRPVEKFARHWKAVDGLRQFCVDCGQPKEQDGGDSDHRTTCPCRACDIRRDVLAAETVRIRREALLLGVAI